LPALFASVDTGLFLDRVDGHNIIAWGSPILRDILFHLVLPQRPNRWNIRHELRDAHLPIAVRKFAGVYVSPAPFVAYTLTNPASKAVLRNLLCTSRHGDSSRLS
jgi:hypothetical protein